MKEPNQFRDSQYRGSQYRNPQYQRRRDYRRQREQQAQQYLYQSLLTEEERAARRTGRAEARRLRRRAQRLRKLRQMMPLFLAAVVLFSAAGGILLVRSLLPERKTDTAPDGPPSEQTDPPAGDIPEDTSPPEDPEPPAETGPRFRLTPDTAILPDGFINSAFAIVIDLDEGTIAAQKSAWNLIHPASMTKILTVLVAAERIRDLDATAVVTQETMDFCVQNDCSIAGFAAGEEVPILDLFYGTILPSGADAAITLAEYTAGSQEAFVGLMNEKAAELGIASTAHFANCVGLYDEKNVCTVYDMAVILKAAMDNELCRQILGQRIYDIPASELHPEGLSLSNWFIRRIEDHMPAGVEVKGAKTGFISQSGNCSASLAQDSAGHTCLCVSAMAGSAWQCIFDHVALYKEYGFHIPDAGPE